MEEAIARFKRYQDRVKSHIKPYIQQLKGFTQSLHDEIVKLHQESAKKDHEIEAMQRKLQEVSCNV